MRYCCKYFFFFKQKTAYEMRISDWSSYVCSSDLGKPEVTQEEPASEVPARTPAKAGAQDAKRDANDSGLLLSQEHKEESKPILASPAVRARARDRKSTRLNSSH